jgi:hypothetical protein
MDIKRFVVEDLKKFEAALETTTGKSPLVLPRFA